MSVTLTDEQVHLVVDALRKGSDAHYATDPMCSHSDDCPTCCKFGVAADLLMRPPPPCTPCGKPSVVCADPTCGLYLCSECAQVPSDPGEMRLKLELTTAKLRSSPVAFDYEAKRLWYALVHIEALCKLGWKLHAERIKEAVRDAIEGERGVMPDSVQPGAPAAAPTGFLTEQEREAIEQARELFDDMIGRPGCGTGEIVNKHLLDMLLRRDRGECPVGNVAHETGAPCFACPPAPVEHLVGERKVARVEGEWHIAVMEAGPTVKLEPGDVVRVYRSAKAGDGR